MLFEHPCQEDEEDEALQIQKVVVVSALLDISRFLFESKEVISSAAMKLQQLCTDFTTDVNGKALALVKAVMVTFNDSIHSNLGVVEAATL